MCYTKVSFVLRVDDENTTKLQSVENKLSEKINNIEAKLLHLNNAVKETHITDRLQESTSTEGNIHTNHMEKAEILLQILVSIQALLYQL